MAKPCSECGLPEGELCGGCSYRATGSAGRVEVCPTCGHRAHPETPIECPACPEGYCEDKPVLQLVSSTRPGGFYETFWRHLVREPFTGSDRL